MNTTSNQKAPAWLVLLAFATVFIVWGSTYFFIGMAVHGFPPMLLGAVRFLTAGAIMLIWSKIKGEKLWIKKDVINAGISGFFVLFMSVGIVIWVEQKLPSALVAIMVSVNPIWFVILDKPNWRTNLKNKFTVWGLLIGFTGVLLLFGESLFKSLSGNVDKSVLGGLALLLCGPIAWSGGSLYSKKHSSSNFSTRLSTAWQMLIAGLFFIPAAMAHHEFSSFHLNTVPLQSWLAIAYLIVFGSIAAFTAYVWLLQVRPATQVSLHSYINPVIAVLLGVSFADESISGLQVFGLIVILFSVLLINLPKYKLSFRLPMFICNPQVNKV
ncbi:EamA family transporter [Mucilaginibacter jinjuensis]|uniref:EamA family transporter n=1 Tax=Mucilaginibacter jinjuensis TaxID=1176721 RepID=A0ABY7T3Y0_9SPHI|nr:EamA family transporter [Mucilaginibacter jinjuensis]WCT11165.1 EamA family transporter [Mucilaginibacter jinjuensis]